MKKEYIILVIVIIALVLYLSFRESDRTYYELPEFTELASGRISRIELKSSDNELDLIKKDDGWVVGAEEYPADKTKVDDILSLLQDLSVTELVSESASYVRYGISDDKKITVKAWAGTQLEKEFDVGKAANTYGHTFIKLPDDKSVYLAEGDFRRNVELSLDDVRDKQVLIFDKNDMTEVIIQSGQQTLALNKKEETEASSNSTTEGTEPVDGEEAKTEVKTVWKTPGGEDVEEGAVGRLLSALSDLKCAGYLEDSLKAELQNPTHSVTLKGEGSEYTISLFEKREE
ncbi:MAG: DUF4340 domain-containing protein, partial [Deltaproteobacteria bacterium]|nr:DUF4340 domain-containing protein [Deltaproteobacteria bacterium]